MNSILEIVRDLRSFVNKLDEAVQFDTSQIWRLEPPNQRWLLSKKLWLEAFFKDEPEWWGRLVGWIERVQ